MVSRLEPSTQALQKKTAGLITCSESSLRSRVEVKSVTVLLSSKSEAPKPSQLKKQSARQRSAALAEANRYKYRSIGLLLDGKPVEQELCL